MTTPVLSAIIPTRDRPDLLRDALATLAVQDVEPDTVEVIVIDDGSAPELRPIIEAAASRGSNVEFRGARQEPSGLNVGRNHGASLARGRIIAYLDDDVLVDAGWARAVIDTFDATGCDAMAGRIQLDLEGPPPAWLTDKLRLYLSELDYGPQHRWLDGVAGELPVGANCAVTRAAFDRIGGFAAGLDRCGASLVSNGDTEFFLRLARSGGTITYCPDADLLHRVPASRLTHEWFVRRARAQGMSDALLEKSEQGLARTRKLLREVARSSRVVPILARNLLDGRGAASASIWLAYCQGRFTALRQTHVGIAS